MEGMSLKALERHKTTFQRIGNRIAYYRKQRRLSQAELAQNIGISVSYMSNIERADLESFAVITLLDIADALGISPRALLAEDDF
jgi:transcriptional regulator with XRE-family HTH domain